MPTPDVVRAVIGFLERANIPYFITGSLASSYYGDPRFTRDIDIALHLDRRSATALCDALEGTDFYVSREAAAEATAELRQFNVIDGAEDFKVDLMVIDDEGYDGLRMSRRRRGTFGDDLAVWYSAPEDVILKKLMFYREGGSDKHLRDSTAMLKAPGATIDWAYAAHWAMRLGVSDLWQLVVDSAEGRAP